MAIKTVAQLRTDMPVDTVGAISAQDINNLLDTMEHRTGVRSPLFKAKKILTAAYRGKLVGIMPNPTPTVTMGTPGANSTVVTDQNTWGSQIVWSDPRLTYYSGKLDSGWWSWITSSSASVGLGATIRFATDAEAIELRMANTAGAGFRVMVDGEWTAENDYTVATGDGSQFVFYKIDFGTGSSRPRIIDISLKPQVYQMHGLNIGPSAGIAAASNPYRIWKAPLPDEPRALVWGDSWVAGVGIGDTNCRAGMVHKAGEYLGIKSIVGSGVGSQGYLAVGNDGDNRTFRARLLAATPSDIEKFGELDLVIIGPTGMNDSGANTTALQTEVSLFAAEVIARQPYALIVVFGPQRSPAVPTSQAVHDAIKAGWLAATGWDTSRMTFVDTFITQNWFDTSTTVGNMTDAFYNTSVPGDDGHVNKAGHIYTGRRMADSIVDWLNTLSS